MDLINKGGYTLKNLGKINIILGKNGCGKSSLFRQVEAALSAENTNGRLKYITPERGGALVYNAATEENINNNDAWLSSKRRKNQSDSFRQQSMAQYRKLETLVLREIEGTRRSETGYTFDSYVDKINSLLDNIQLKRAGAVFKILKKGTDNEVPADAMSSGESELVSLGIECLIFSREIISGKENIIFLDEPDVHLHPDLQVRLMHFLRDLVSSDDFRVIIATHSTAILGALEDYDDTQLAFLKSGQTIVEFQPISGVYRKILPVFGAHPLSNIFNQAPVLLLEGEDDERIWQQVVRTSKGTIKLYPCAVEGVSLLEEFEKETKDVIETVYDNARGFSLRDKDDGNENIDDLPPITRMKLSCRNAENLLVTDEVLLSLGSDWNSLKTGIDDWLSKYATHSHFVIMNGFKESAYDRKDFNIKEIRNDIMGIIQSSKPWEVAVGQVIAKLEWDNSTDFSMDGKIMTFLGEKTVKSLIPKKV